MFGKPSTPSASSFVERVQLSPVSGTRMRTSRSPSSGTAVLSLNFLSSSYNSKAQVLQLFMKLCSKNSRMLSLVILMVVFDKFEVNVLILVHL